MNQFVFYSNDRTNRHNIRVANATLQIDIRRNANFEISQNDENIVDSNFDSLHVDISIKRFLQNITFTTNNRSIKRKKNVFLILRKRLILFSIFSNLSQKTKKTF